MILPLFFGASLFFLIYTAGPPFRGAKSSQKFRAAAYLRPTFPRRDLLPASRKALRHRPGEQNLHRNSAPPPATGGLFSGAICSPPPAKPCGIVSGSKIFTEIPRRHLPPAAFSAARFAPRPPQSLAASFRGAKSSQKFRAGVCPAADHVGAVPPAKPYITVGPRQQGAPKPACRPIMLAPPLRQSLNPPSGHANRAPKIPPGGRPCWRRPFRQSLNPPSGHANRAPKIPPGGRPCWRRPSGKTIYHRRATPTGRPGYDEKEKDCRYLSILKNMEQVSAV